VREIFRWLIEEHLSCRAIAKRLTESGIPSPKGYKVWHPGVVNYLVRQEAYCWDGGKTWVVEDEPTGTAGRIARASPEAMNEIHRLMRPGVRIGEIQEKSQRTVQRLKVPQHQSVLTYFHGLGLYGCGSIGGR